MHTDFEGKNTKPGTCRDCGQEIGVGEGVVYSVMDYDWDDPDTDAQGSIMVEKARYMLCYNATQCAERVVERGSYIPALRTVANDTENCSPELRSKARAILADYAKLFQDLQLGEDYTAREGGYGVIGGHRG